MRSGGVLAALVCALALAGCGGEEQPGSPLGRALQYFPGSAATIAVVPSDLDSAQYRGFDRSVGRGLLDGDTAEGALRELVEESDVDLDYEDDVAPVLGNPVAIGTPAARTGSGAPLLAAVEVRDRGKAKELLERLGLNRQEDKDGAEVYGLGEESPAAAIDGDVLVAADKRAALDDALEQRDRAGHVTEQRFDSALGGLPRDALVRGYGNLAAVLRTGPLRGLRSLPWPASLRTAGFTASFGQRRLELRVRVDGDPSGVDDADLPFPPGEPEPRLLVRPGEVLAASANQSRTTVFLLDAVRQAFPDSEFAEVVRRLERELRIDFEDEVLRQFDGPSASALTLDGRFAARSAVRDPERMARLLDDLAPRMPEVVGALNKLRVPGISLLFLFAPDAPTARPIRGPRVTRVRGERRLYRMTGLDELSPPPEVPQAVPAEVVFGLVGDVFVVASDEGRARRVARAPTEPAPGLRGASVLRADPASVRGVMRRLLGADPGEVGEARGSVRVTRSRLDAELGVELP